MIPSASVKYRSGPVFYDFHQDPDFFYLTGFLEAESVAVIGFLLSCSFLSLLKLILACLGHKRRRGVRVSTTSTCLCGPRTSTPSCGMAPAPASMGPKPSSTPIRCVTVCVYVCVGLLMAQQTYDVRQLHLHMTPLLERAAAVYADVPKQPLSAYAALFDSAAAHNSPPGPALGGRPIQPLRPTMHQLRATKSGAEAAVMRQAGKMSGRTYTEAMRRGFASEKELWAFLDYSFRSGGCDCSAYVPVVAGGTNALSVHYTSNDSLLR